MFVYNPNFTQQSKLAPNWLADLNELCQRDYKRSFFAEPIVCLDLDEYEKACFGDNDATMDAGIGIADWQNNHATGGRHLLVELRFDYRSTSNFDLVNMKRKVAHSRNVLLPERINEQVVFLYEPNVASQAKNYFKRLARQDHSVQSWEAMDVDDFSQYVVDSSTLPYQPENDINAIEIDLKNKYATGGFHEVEKLVDYWINQMELYDLRYKHAESNAIAEVILSFLDTLSLAKGSFEYEFLRLIKDEVGGFKHD